jgi:hypothetical protein
VACTLTLRDFRGNLGVPEAVTGHTGVAPWESVQGPSGPYQQEAVAGFLGRSPQEFVAEYHKGVTPSGSRLDASR